MKSTLFFSSIKDSKTKTTGCVYSKCRRPVHAEVKRKCRLMTALSASLWCLRVKMQKQRRLVFKKKSTAILHTEIKRKWQPYISLCCLVVSSGVDEGWVEGGLSSLNGVLGRPMFQRCLNKERTAGKSSIHFQLTNTVRPFYWLFHFQKQFGSFAPTCSLGSGSPNHLMPTSWTNVNDLSFLMTILCVCVFCERKNRSNQLG